MKCRTFNTTQSFP